MTLVENIKAGMDSIEFAKYIFSTILPLFPDSEDTPVKRVAIIVDSGPGRVNSSMLVQLRIRGFYLIPGVPNTTHGTQATDVNYGIFKSVYQDHLVKMTEYRVRDESDKKTIHPNDILLMIFGGGPQEIDPKNTFEDSFGFEKNQDLG